MSATMAATGITHAVRGQRYATHHATAACGVLIAWKDPIEKSYFATRSDKEVDCMACIAADAGQESLAPRDGTEPAIT